MPSDARELINEYGPDYLDIIQNMGSDSDDDEDTYTGYTVQFQDWADQIRPETWECESLEDANEVFDEVVGLTDELMEKCIIGFIVSILRFENGILKESVKSCNQGMWGDPEITYDGKVS